MSKKKAPSKAEDRLTAAELARQEVEAWFEAIVEEQETLIAGDGNIPMERLDKAFDTVLKKLEEEHEPRITDKTDSMTVALVGVRAGYLIGIQVGLRLRNVGGVR